jgi:hypothetical protein
MTAYRDIIKTRDLHFSAQANDIDQAQKACALLHRVQGVESAKHTRTSQLSIRYDVRVLTLQMIEAALKDVGFVLNNSLICRIRRSLFAYCEDAQRASLGVENQNDRAIIDHTDTVAHDPRPYNWRNYL